jgi:hypothetical protein
MLDISIAQWLSGEPPSRHRRSASPKPVIFPPGWAMLATKPAPTGSETIGIVCVSPRSNAVTGVEFARTTSG